MTTEEKKQFVVIGVNKSGTSVVAGILYYLGIDMFLDTKANKNAIDLANKPVAENNPFKYNQFECQAMCVMNNRFIKLIEKDRRCIGSEDWRIIDNIQDKKIISYIKRRNDKSNVWGVKDPRLIYTYPLWHKNLSNPKIIITIRDIRELARSFSSRERVSIQRARAIINSGMICLDGIKKISNDLLIVVFDDLLTNKEKVIKEIADYVGVKDYDIEHIKSFIYGKTAH